MTTHNELSHLRNAVVEQHMRLPNWAAQRLLRLGLQLLVRLAARDQTGQERLQQQQEHSHDLAVHTASALETGLMSTLDDLNSESFLPSPACAFPQQGLCIESATTTLKFLPKLAHGS